MGFQEYESSAYLKSILKDNDFEIQKAVFGIPPAWFATWSNGDGPVVALGGDVDYCISKASQYLVGA